MEKTYQLIIPTNNYNSIMGLDTWPGPSENEYQSWGYFLKITSLHRLIKLLFKSHNDFLFSLIHPLKSRWKQYVLFR